MLATSTAAALAVALPAAGAQAPKRPSGTYESGGGKVMLSVSGNEIVVAALDFRCRSTTGRISVNDVAITRRRGRFRFSTRTFSNATYRDDHPDENARVRLSGRFSPTARVVVGTLVVTSPHCGRTRELSWSATR